MPRASDPFPAPLELIRAAIFHAPADPFHEPNALVAFMDGGLLLRSGRIVSAGDFAAVRGRAPNAPITDWRGGYVLPGFIDAHVHFPQLRIVGRFGHSLLDWLEQVALPEEARMADLRYAEATAELFVRALLAHGTTSALVFGAHFAPATAALFDVAAGCGLRLTSGVVCSDRGLREELHQRPADAYRDASLLVARVQAHDRLRYAVTPRFAPATSEAMLEVCQSLCREHPSVMIQTHLNEQRSEVDAVRRLFPWASDYLHVYERYGLSGPRAVFAHSIWTTDGEMERLAASGAAVAHCPGSNAALGSGIFSMRRHLAAGVRFALGTDVGAGVGVGMLKESLLAALMQRVATDGQTLRAEHLLYLSTMGGARALGLDREVGDFQAGKAADLVLIRPHAGTALAAALERAASAEDALSALITQASSDSVREVRIEGRRVYAADARD